MLKLTLYIEPYAGGAHDAAPEPDRKSPIETFAELAPTLLTLYRELAKSPYATTPVEMPTLTSPTPPEDMPLYTPPPKPVSAFAAEPDHPFHPDSSIAGPGPSPATPSTNAMAFAETRRQAKLTEGFEAFTALLHLWQQGFGEEGVPQPDRGAALRDLCEGPTYGRVLGWIQATGGLRVAIRKATDPRYVPQPLVDKLAENIAQVASALQYTDLSNLLELTPRLPIITET